MKILIAEDDPVSNRLLQATLVSWGHEVVSTTNGKDAWRILQQQDTPLLAILDWVMPEIEGVDVCRRVRQEISDVPVYLILLSAKSSKENLIEGLDAGADDYLTKPFDRHELRVRLKTGARIVELQKNLHDRVKELEEAIIERQRAEEALRNLSLTDPMTGLYNYRGFFTLAEHQARIARRTGQSSLLLYADMDGLKRINDTFGHADGSVAISKIGEVLRKTFREYDIVARLGGDEFAVLASNVSAWEVEGILERLNGNLRAYNDEANQPWALGLSIGAIMMDPREETTIEEQIERADKAMYKDKQKKRAELQVA
jgi:diguanylate cyclase (GGDEF)-like protein